MADPVIVTCTKDAWVKVATNVVTGTIHKKSSDPKGYLQTYRLTGTSAPTDLTDAIKAFIENEYEIIDASPAIDVYIYAQGKAGAVRADL